ncbi:AgmX/PglI C-terminal domain-containing protein [Microbulbifer echini]|uniref:AgmX/PglI C-terminal domain-containing protein n=1 Tax=Microbulbifer echini TaxID=1529067 RepID=A0ABV4NSN3_9GAMM|nr:AgmX/PglI C-terminal domain-containing protein [uncultured Microbulbifer sp.]
MSKNSIRIWISAALFLSATSTSAEIHKWVDHNGQTRYSDKKTDGIELATHTQKIKRNQERSKDEIQRVFDKHKGTLYRLYLSALKNNPTLAGKADFILTIEPGGKVSSITVAHTTLNSKVFINQVTANIQQIDFGPSDARKTTTHYPLYFLPAKNAHQMQNPHPE